ncbi:MAG: phospholipase D family protein [Pseudaminobacter sp.]|nr:phospholipase D family protein [Pseudaminobacter sp.]
MNTALIIIAILSFAAFLTLYTLGRLAPRAIGKPSRSLPVEAEATPIDRMVAPVTRAHPGESGVILLSNNLDAFAARALTVQEAGRSLDLMCYMWHDDLTGRLLTQDVLKAADRGVRVRVLLDDINAQGFDATTLAVDSHPNIEIRLFNPSQNREGAIVRAFEMMLNAINLNRRMHNKAWIADGRIAIIGGRNVGDEYFDAAELSNFRDLDLLMIGDSVRQTEILFDAYWNSKAVMPIGSLYSSRLPDFAITAEKLRGSMVSEKAKPYLQRVASTGNLGDLVSGKWHIHWMSDVRVVSDPPEKVFGHKKGNWLLTELGPMMASAKNSLEIISPYFIPGAIGSAALAAFVKAGVDVSVLTNSLAATDVASVHGGYANYRRRLLQDGVKLFELKAIVKKGDLSLFGASGGSLHTKAFTVDATKGFVGSFNFDPRSVSLNTEMGLLFEDAVLAAELQAIFREETSGRHSYRLFLDDGALRWADDAAPEPKILTSEPGAGFWRRVTAFVLGRLPIERWL